MLADQRRLVAPGERIDDARLLGRRASRGPASASASTLTMTMCLPLRDRRAGSDGCRRRARRSPRRSPRCADRRSVASALSVTNVARCLCASSSETRRVMRVRPAGRLAAGLRARATSRSATPDHMHAARQPRLRQKHGAELAGADQPDGDRPARGLALEQFGMKVHRQTSWPAKRTRHGVQSRDEALLAERARDEGLACGTGAAVAAGEIDLRRADLGGGHVEALAAYRSPSPCTCAIAAATQSGAPFGAILHFSWPATTRGVADAARPRRRHSLALSTVVLAASPASRPKFSTSPRPMPCRDVDQLVRLPAPTKRPMLPKKPGCCLGGAALAAGAWRRLLREGQRRAHGTISASAAHAQHAPHAIAPVLNESRVAMSHGRPPPDASSHVASTAFAPALPLWPPVAKMRNADSRQTSIAQPRCR